MSSTGKTIDDLQNKIDSLILSLFEAMRSPPEQTNVNQQTQAFVEKYYETVETIDNLVGIDRDRSGLQEEVEEVSGRFASCQARVMELQSALLATSQAVEEELNQVINSEQPISFTLTFASYPFL
eukprot:gene2150-2345_t